MHCGVHDRDPSPLLSFSYPSLLSLFLPKFRNLLLVVYACSLKHLPGDWEKGRYWPEGVHACKPFVASFVELHVAALGIRADRERLVADFSQFLG